LESGRLRSPRKGRIKEILSLPDWNEAIEALSSFPERGLTSSLISLLYEGDPLIRGRTIAALGQVVGRRLAERDLEAARVVMRRLMWSLNDESGGIGWGAAEAMAEIMAQSDPLAEEYARILVSYLDPRGNFLEHEPLHPGLMWAIARLAETRPLLVGNSVQHLGRYLGAKNPETRGLASLAAGLLAAEQLLPQLRELAADEAEFLYFREGLHRRSVGDTARRAVASVRSGGPNAGESDRTNPE
jgi:HEAT repeat protein